MASIRNREELSTLAKDELIELVLTLWGDLTAKHTMSTAIQELKKRLDS